MNRPHQINFALSESDYALLVKMAQDAGKQPTKLAADIVKAVLRDDANEHDGGDIAG